MTTEAGTFKVVEALRTADRKNRSVSNPAKERRSSLRELARPRKTRAVTAQSLFEKEQERRSSLRELAKKRARPEAE